MEVSMNGEDKKQQREDGSPGLDDESQWMSDLMREVDGELEQVTAQLRESYTRLFSSLEKLDREIEAAVEEGDEMKYQAAQIKKGLVESRLRELEALNILS